MDLQKSQSAAVEGESAVMYCNAPSNAHYNVLCTKDRYQRVCTQLMEYFLQLTCYSTAFNNEAEDEEERALTHSLCLAQKTADERLAELEKQCLVEESQRLDLALTMLASEQEDYKSYPTEEEDINASEAGTAASDIFSDTMTIESGDRASKLTSMLLGTILEQQECTRKHDRLTWTSVESQQQSVLESDTLLRNWTNQRDPLAWDHDDDSEDESVAPSDSVSKYHGRSHSESAPKETTRSMFLESICSSTNLTSEQRPPLTTLRSLDAADRSRQKVAKLTGEDYTAITADWMWRMNEHNGTTAMVPLPPLEPLQVAEPSKARKRSKQLRWVNDKTLLGGQDDLSRELEARLRVNGLLP